MLGWFAKFVQIWQDHRHAIIKSVNCAGLRRGHWSSSGRALELQTNPIMEKAHTWTFSWFKGTSFLMLPHVRLLIKNWRIFGAWWPHERIWWQRHSLMTVCISASLRQSAAPLAQFSPTAVASHCSWMPRPHTHPCHIDTVTVSASPEERREP